MPPAKEPVAVAQHNQFFFKDLERSCGGPQVSRHDLLWDMTPCARLLTPFGVSTMLIERLE